MTVALIAAVARNGTIGHQGKLPWHIREDLQRFKRLTMGHTIVMGRKTFDSIGRPLPGRRNIVLSRSLGFHAPDGVEVFSSLDAALQDCKHQGVARVFVIGGAEIYRQALEFADELLLTLIPADVAGDTKFPSYDENQWTEMGREQSVGCSFVNYHRRSPSR